MSEIMSRTTVKFVALFKLVKNNHHVEKSKMYLLLFSNLKLTKFEIRIWTGAVLVTPVSGDGAKSFLSPLSPSFVIFQM